MSEMSVELCLTEIQSWLETISWGNLVWQLQGELSKARPCSLTSHGPCLCFRGAGIKLLRALDPAQRSWVSRFALFLSTERRRWWR